MSSTRLNSFVVCLGMACLVLAGNVRAGTTMATELTYAREVGALGTLYDIPAGNGIGRVMGVLRQAASGNFFLRLTLSDNAEFAAGGLPVAGDLTQTAGAPGGNVAITARVWTLPVAGGTEALLGSVSLGSLGAGAGRNIKLAEDVLAHVPGLTLPYTDDGGRCSGTDD